MKQTILSPSRMSCASIAATLKGILNSVPGVSDVDVKYDTEEVVVTYDEERTNPAALIAAVGSERGIAMQEKRGQGEEDIPRSSVC